MKSQQLLLTYFLPVANKDLPVLHELYVTLNNNGPFHVINIEDSNISEKNLLELYQARFFQNKNYPVTVRIPPKDGQVISDNDKQVEVTLSIETNEFLVSTHELNKLYD